MSIKDDGVGFEMRDTEPGAHSLGGNGMRNMRGRAAAMGAELQIESVVAGGTDVLIKIPIK